MRIADRTEYQSKAPPLTCGPDTTVSDAVTQMAEKNFGSIFITDPENHILGVMTTEVRMASKDDKILDWLQVMSNERFRRLPIVDENKKLVAVMSQGDFVSYTWPQLLGQLGQMAQATIAPIFNPLSILLGVLTYTVVLVLILLYAI